MLRSVRRTSLAGVTIREVVVVTLVLAVVLTMYVNALDRDRDEARRVRCSNNLHQLAKGMATYINEHGDARWYPCPLGRTMRRNGYNGAEWLASLYWTGTTPDPGVFICPSSEDENRDGVDLGAWFQASTFGSRSVSYAGMHHDVLGPGSGVPLDDMSAHTIMASDDTQGDINHDAMGLGGMNTLCFDGSVTFESITDLDPERAVGDTAPDALLRDLRN